MFIFPPNFFCLRSEVEKEHCKAGVVKKVQK